MSAPDQIKNYENSYKSLWEEINRTRKQRDDALKMVDVARDLVVALEHDFGAGTTVASLRTHDAFNRLRSRMFDRWSDFPTPPKREEGK